MLNVAKYWWVPMLRGVAAVIFGILAIVLPGMALATMAMLFGIFAFVDGAVAIAGLFRADTRRTSWFLQLLVGVTGILAGIVTFTYPGLTTVGLLAFIAAYAVVVGLGQLISAILQSESPGSPALGISGVVSLLFGVMMYTRPQAGVLALAWLVGVYAIIVGAGSISMGSALYRLQKQGPRLRATLFPSERVEAGRKP